MLVKGLIPVRSRSRCAVCGFECELEHMGFFSVCDQPFDNARSCVGNVDNVLHNFESVPCLTPAVQHRKTGMTNEYRAVDRLGLSCSYTSGFYENQMKVLTRYYV